MLLIQNLCITYASTTSKQESDKNLKSAKSKCVVQGLDDFTGARIIVMEAQTIRHKYPNHQESMNEVECTVQFFKSELARN